MKRWFKGGLVLAGAALLAGCSGGGEGNDSATPVALVSLAPVTQGAVAETVTVYGQIENGTTGRRVLATPVEATLLSVPAPVGSAVRRGDLVARLSPSPTSAVEIAKAEADAAAAVAAYARARRLHADGLASDADVETARAAAAGASAARASFARSRAGLALRAPAAGYVETVAFAPGDTVPAGGTVATIATSGALRVRFGIDPALAGRVHPGMALNVTAPGGKALQLRIAAVDPVIDPTTRLASLFATVPAGSGFGANAALTCTVALSSGGEAPSVPYVALLDDAGQPYVFTVSNGVAHRREVEPGPVSGDRVAILKGLKAGERVVTAGGTALEDDMKVRLR